MCLNSGTCFSVGHMFGYGESQSRPISIVSLKSGASARSFSISLGSDNCVTRSRPGITYPRFDSGVAHCSLFLAETSSGQEG